MSVEVDNIGFFVFVLRLLLFRGTFQVPVDFPELVSYKLLHLFGIVVSLDHSLLNKLIVDIPIIGVLYFGYDHHPGLLR